MRAASTGQSVKVQLITADAELGEHIEAALAMDRRFTLETVRSPAGARLAEKPPGAAAVIIEINPDDAADLAALESFVNGQAAGPPVIVMSGKLSDGLARRLLRLRIADWLPKTCAAAELTQTIERALQSRESAGGKEHARCVAFYPALGGAGNTAIAIASALVLGGEKQPFAPTCAVDLNFQTGSVADYLDLQPNLHLAEIEQAPHRLDAHLLEVMLSQHKSGLKVLAAANSLNAFDTASAATVEHLLELVSGQFRNVVFDLPRVWLPWSANILRGADRFFIVTESTVPGLRSAKRIADHLEQKHGLETQATVIVNKCPRFVWRGITKSDARSLLGGQLAGFIPNCPGLVNEAVNRGVPLTDVKKSNKFQKGLASILLQK